MPHETFPDSSHPPEEWEINEELLTDILATREEASAKLADIRVERQNYSGPDSLRYNIVSHVREKQLKKQADVVLDMSLHSTHGMAIDLDDLLHLLDDTLMPESEYLAMAGMGYRELAVEGVEQAINTDLLPLLAPDDITDETMRDIYYYPWPKRVIESVSSRGYHALGQLASFDKPIRFSRPTRLANIEVVFHYVPGEDEPRRLLRIKDAPTPTSSLQ